MRARKAAAAPSREPVQKDVQEPPKAPVQEPAVQDLEFSLHIGEKRAQQMKSGEKNFALDRALTFDIDDVLPVGVSNIKPQRAVARAAPRTANCWTRIQTTGPKDSA